MAAWDLGCQNRYLEQGGQGGRGDQGGQGDHGSQKKRLKQATKVIKAANLGRHPGQPPAPFRTVDENLIRCRPPDPALRLSI